LQIAKSSDGFQITLDMDVKSQHQLNALYVDGGYGGIAFWIALGISTFPTLWSSLEFVTWRKETTWSM